jgi:hypothetical protein
MARRSLSLQGRIVAAGVSIAVGSALVGFMAAGDHSADASPTNPSSASATGDSSAGAAATPYDGRDLPTGNSGFSPQPQTRTGGS